MNIVAKIEKYKKKKAQKDDKMTKIVKEYEKADLLDRVKKYERKSFYEELKIKELEIRNKMYFHFNLTKYSLKDNEIATKKQFSKDPTSQEKKDIMMKNIVKQSGRDGLHSQALVQKPSNVPFSNFASFKNMSEKERYLKITTEFNKVKAQVDSNKHEEYDFCYLYIKARLDNKFDPTRQQVKNFLKFIKNERREFNLQQKLEEIIQEVINREQEQSTQYLESQVSQRKIASPYSNNSPQRLQSLDRAQTADVLNKRMNQQYHNRLLDIIQDL